MTISKYTRTFYFEPLSLAVKNKIAFHWLYHHLYYVEISDNFRYTLCVYIFLLIACCSLLFILNQKCWAHLSVFVHFQEHSLSHSFALGIFRPDHLLWTLCLYVAFFSLLFILQYMQHVCIGSNRIESHCMYAWHAYKRTLCTHKLLIYAVYIFIY